MINVKELANVLQVCPEIGAKKVRLPITSAVDIGAVPTKADWLLQSHLLQQRKRCCI